MSGSACVGSGQSVSVMRGTLKNAAAIPRGVAVARADKALVLDAAVHLAGFGEVDLLERCETGLELAPSSVTAVMAALSALQRGLRQPLARFDGLLRSPGEHLIEEPSLADARVDEVHVLLQRVGR
jgi:hypothetical protein